MTKNKMLKLEDIVGDVVYINLDDISYLETDELSSSVKIKFKNTVDEHKFTDITTMCIDSIKKLFP